MIVTYAHIDAPCGNRFRQSLDVPLPKWAVAVREEDCICIGNWRAIIKESEPNFGKEYTRNGIAYRFLGVLHADDDYYYAMYNSYGKLCLLSCVGNIESFGYRLNDKA